MNGLFHTLLAAVDFDPIAGLNGSTTSSSSSMTMRDTLIIVGAALVIGLLFVIWAVYIRKPGGSKRSEPSNWSAKSKSDDDDEDDDSGESGGRRRKKRKKLRREHRPRNPTLSETGGLPPMRSNSDSGTDRPNAGN